jgi:ATP-dependent exoDNAse (exonuclease V) beta subunit
VAPSTRIVTATEFVKLPEYRASDRAVAIVDVSTDEPRPSGRRFGILVHAVLAHVPLDASPPQIHNLAVVHARLLAATDAERDAAAAIAARATGHDLWRQAQAAAAAGRACRREAPISILCDGILVDGQIDLAFEAETGWIVVDFKTDVELGGHEAIYRQQVALYADALASITSTPVSAAILRL